MKTDHDNPLLALKPTPCVRRENPLLSNRFAKYTGTNASQELRLVTRTARRTPKEMLRIKRATEQLRELPRPNETLHLICQGDFAAFDLIPTVHAITGERIERLHIVTLGFSRKNVAQLATMMDADEVGEVSFLFSHYFINTSREESLYMLDVLGPRGVRIAAMRTHAKIILIETRSHAVVIETSANLRSCHNVEQFVIADDRELLDFHARWIDAAITRIEHASRQTQTGGTTREAESGRDRARAAVRGRVPVDRQRGD